MNVQNTIESFLSGTASVSEKAWLTKEMKHDPALAREFNLRRRTDEILTGRDIIGLRSKLGTIEMKKRSAGGIQRTAAKAAKYAAAIAIVALISSVLYFVLRPASTPDELYSSYYSGYVSPGAVRSAVSSGNSLMDNALALYGAREYDKAIGYLEQVIANDQGNMEPVFMHGMANMEVSNFPVAEGSFSQVIDHNDNLYIEDAAWYLGLCYMMTDEKEKALNQFNAIAGSNSRHSREAAKLIRKLK